VRRMLFSLLMGRLCGGTPGGTIAVGMFGGGPDNGRFGGIACQPWLLLAGMDRMEGEI